MRRALGLAVVATLAGVVLQCASDPAIVGDGGIVERWLADLGITDGVKGDGRGRDAGRDGPRLDSIGPKADAAPGSADWFTMSYVRNGGAPDKLLAPGSDVSVSVGHVFDAGTLVPAVVLLSFGVNNESVLGSASLALYFNGVVSPSTVAASSLNMISLVETERTTTGTGKTLYSCSWMKSTTTKCQTSGTVTFTKVGVSMVAGSYSLTLDDGAGQKRVLTGQFEATPYPPNAELKP